MKIEKNPKNFPLVSVVMPVFNSEKFVSEALRSILNQSYRNIELIVVNDGSTDRSAEIIKNLQKEDKRIIIIEQPNRGIVSARNVGCRHAKGDYIAILDSDDIALEKRIEKQVDYLENHNDVGICGSWVKTIEVNPKIRKYPCDNDKIKCSLLFSCPFSHSSVMMRRTAIPFFPEIYSESFDTVEDYKLWVTCMNVTKYSNLSEPLVLYRIHQENVSILFKKEQEERAIKVLKDLLKNFDINPSDDEIHINNSFYLSGCVLADEYLSNVHTWLSKLYTANSIKNILPKSSLFELFSEMWYRACIKKTMLGLKTWNIYWKSPFIGSFHLSWTRKVKLLIYCLIKINH